MSTNTSQTNESAIGTEGVTVKYGPAEYRSYLVDRPTLTQSLRGAEGVLDITIKIAHSVQEVWPIFINFNLWMNRFGYVWDSVPAENADRFVTLGNVGTANNLNFGLDGSRNRYVVRKVVKEQLIYFDSLPLRLTDVDARVTGHNVMFLREVNGQTEISVFIEHTWYSETMNLEDLRAEARKLMFVDAVAFWRDYFVRDLVSLIETGKVSDTRQPAMSTN
jgi:hypothetical protein